MGKSRMILKWLLTRINIYNSIQQPCHMFTLLLLLLLLFHCYYYYRLPAIRSTKTADLRRAAIRQSVGSRPTEPKAMYQPRPPTSKRPSEKRRTPLHPMRDTKSSQARKVKVVKTKDEKIQRNNGKYDIFLRIICSYSCIVEAWFKLGISIPFPTYACTHPNMTLNHYTVHNSELCSQCWGFGFLVYIPFL